MADQSSQVAICNVCGEAAPAVLVSKDGCDVHQCKGCGLAFTHPQPVGLEEQYDSGYFDLYRRRRPFRLKRGDARLRRIELIRQPGRLLDVGCSLGYFVEAAHLRDWHASGVEISTHAAREAAEMGLDVVAGTLEQAAYPDRSFDCVTMWDVLEHVPDPTAHMLEVNRILVDGGLVVIGTPDLAHVQFRMKRERWRHLKPAEHIYYFQHDSIRRLLNKTGFELIEPRLVRHRSFAGCHAAAFGAWASRLVRLNDVMTVYGVKNAL